MPTQPKRDRKKAEKRHRRDKERHEHHPHASSGSHDPGDGTVEVGFGRHRVKIWVVATVLVIGMLLYILSLDDAI